MFWLLTVLASVTAIASAQLPDCTSAQSNSSRCREMYLVTGSECGYSGNQNACTHCFGGQSMTCSASPPNVSPCIYSGAQDACVSSGFTCSTFNTAGTCNRSAYFLQPCVFDTSNNVCQLCSAFTAANCPSPSCAVDSANCRSSVDACASFPDKNSCIMNGPMNSCYYDDARNSCYYCGQLTSQISCDNSPICHWVPSNQSCVFGPLASREAANDDAAWSVSKRLAVALPVAFGAVLVCVVVLGIVFKKFPCCHEQRPAKAILLDDGVESTTLRSIKDVSFDESSRTTGTGISTLRTTATRQVSQIVLSMPSGSATSVGSGGGSELALQAPALFQDGRVQRLKLLGRGANGSVYSCVLPDGYQVAMKEILLPPPTGKEGHEELVASILKEVSIVSSLDHPNVVRFFGSALETEEHRLTIFMELIPNGSLASMVSSMPDPMKEDVARVFVRQLVAALAYIHEKGVVHRDVKCDNILLTGEGRLKLTDFGASKVVGTGTLATRGAQTMIGTPYFMAPEILVGLGDDSDGSYGRRADIWSLGITVVEMMECGKAPWPDFPSTGAAFMHIATPGSLPIIPARFSNEARDFVMQCCRRDPLERPTSKTLLTHPWLTSNFDVAVK